MRVYLNKLKNRRLGGTKAPSLNGCEPGSTRDISKHTITKPQELSRETKSYSSNSSSINRRELFYTISMLLAITGVVFFLNIMILSSAWSVTLFRGSSQVKAVAIVQTNKPHFIKASQKLELLTLLNDGELFDKREPLSFNAPSNFKKLSLHCFGESAIDVIPVGTSGEKLVFAIERGKERSLLVEKQAGQIQKVIDKVLED